MKKEDRKQLYALLKIWARSQIIARVGGIGGPHQVAFQEKLNMEDAILELMYGTSDLVELGLKWKLLEPRPDKKKRGKKVKKELLDFFGGEPIKKKRKRRKKQ